MNKAHRCLLHLACIAVKLSRGQSVQWHWDHLIREFGIETDHKQPLQLDKLDVVPHHHI